MSNNPTIVAASLDDKQMHQSIVNLVAEVKRATHTMTQDFDSVVDHINAKFKELGNGKNASAKGGVSANATKQSTQAVEEHTNALKKDAQAASQQVTTADKQIKKNQEVSMSFDQIVAALDRARRTVSDFNTKRANGVLPSTEDYKRYEQALARIVEYNDKLKQSALGMANANEKWFGGFNAKRINESILPSNKTLSEMRAFYQEQEKNDQKRLAAREKMIEDARKAEQKYQDATLKSAFRGALTLPTNNIDELKYKIERITALTSTLKKEGLIDESQVNRANVAVAKLNEQINKQLATEKEVKAVQSQQAQPQVKSARDSYIAFMQGYKEQANQLTQLIQNEENRLVQAQQSRVTALGQQIDQNKTKIQGLREQMQQLAQEEKNAPTRYGVKDAYRTAIQQTNDEINKLIAKNKELEAEQQKVASTDPLKQQNATLDELRAKRDKVLNMMREETSSTHQQAQAQQQLTQSAKEYSEQVKKIATEIRESAQWQKSDKFGFKRGMMNFDGRAYPVTENLEMGIRLEDQIVSVLQRANDERQKGVQITQQQAQSSRQVSEEDRKAMEALGWVDSQQKKKYTPPVMNIERISEVRGALQSITGTQEKWVDSISKTKSSYFQLSDYVKQLKNELIHLPKGVHDDAAKVLISEIQQAEREMQKFQKTMSRPVSLKSALSGDEKTLDDITYKIQRLRSYKQGIDFKSENGKREMQEVDKALQKLQKEMDKYMSKSKEVNAVNNALGRSWNYMKNRLAFYLTVGATTQFVKSLVDIRGQYELLERSIGILVDSAQNGSRIFAELNAMAIKSPFTTMELGAAAKQLVAYDVAAKDVVDTTKRLADMAAAVGVPIERLTYALGQIKSYSYLNARDARMFANTGIPLVKNLADMYTKLEGRLVSTSDVYDRIKKKAVSYNDVMRVINEMTDEGGKFFNFQEKAADTLKVKIANLTLAYNNMLNEMGKSEQGFISGGLGALKTLMEHWRDVYNTILALVPAYGAAKIAQLLLFKAVNKTTMATAAQAVFSEKLVAKWQAVTVAAKGATAASIGVSLATAGVLALVAVLGKLAWDYYDLKKANEEFNKSVADGAEENIQSISKFFDDYKKELKEISGASSSDQNKMWERMQEEIEKTVRNAQDYIDILEKIDDTASRIKAGEAILGQQQVIEQEIKDFASRGMLDLGGGFADDSMAKDLEEYDKWAREFTANFDKLTEQSKKNVGLMLQTYAQNTKEVDAEIDKFIGKLQSLNFEKIMGDFDKQTQFANIRNAVSSIRDGFLATEQGSKIGYEGQARLNSALDKFISSLGRSKNLIQDVTVNSYKYSASQVAAIEANRSAWETFFSRLKPNQKKMLDFAVKTGRMNVKQLQEIWDYAAKEMQKTDLTAFTSIQDHIAQLRNTPDIVLNIVYKERTEKSKDPVIRDYTEHFLTPSKVWDADAYIKKEEELYKKYGTLIKKEGEDRVEWGERVFKTIHDEEKKAAEATKALAELQKELTTETKRAGDARYQAAKKQKEESEEIIKNAKEVVKYEKLHDKEKKKGKQKDPILEALKLETELVEKLNAEYEGLMKNGAKSPEALASLHKTFGKTISQLNSQLKSFGLPQLDLAKILVGRNPKKQLEHFQKTLRSLVKNGLLNMERSKVVEAVIEKVSIRAKNYDLTELSKGIEKELNKLKESFDLGTALDAEPQLGNLFAKMYGFDAKELPRTFDELVQKAQSIIDNAFKGKDEARIDVSAILDKKAFEEWVKGTERELGSSLVQTVQKMRDYLVETQRKMVSDTNKEYDKLLERYSEYQFKLIKIDKDSAADRLALIRKFATAQQTELVKNAANIANQITLSTDPEERERLSKELQNIIKQVAGNNRIVLQIGVGIDNKEAEEKAQVAFDEFTKNPIWRTAIGDLEGMTHDALRTLIDDLEDFRKANTKLTPKQINQIEKTITKLHRQIRKGNPFRVLADDIDNVEERTKEYEMYIGNLENELQTRALIPDNLKSEDDKKRIIELRKEIEKLKKEVDKVGKIDVTTVFSRINDSVSVINQISSSISKMLDELGGERATAASKAISDITGNLEAAGRGAQIGASFGGYGAAIGAVAGGLTDLVTRFADAWSGNADITEKVEDSIRAVKRLEMAYAGLEYQIKKTYGEAEIYAKRLLTENKKAQLAELQNQLTLERSRKSKNRDADKELELQARIESLTREIEESVKEITDSLLGISSVKDAATQLVESMIDAFKQGEDYMQNFEDSFEKMIENMIVQAVVGKVIGDKIQQLVDFVDSQTNAVDQGLLDEYKKNEEKIRRWTEVLDNPENEFDANTVKDVERKLKELKERNEALQSQMAEKAVITPELIEESRKMKEGLMNETREMFDFYMDLFGIKFGQDMNLSNLQQGISAITEDTANALEAYMNGVSQQVYAHTELLTEIRDAVIAFNGDATLGVQSQMLLQLQNNYILMQTMQTLMENWTVPSGNGIRVELMN